MKILLITGTDPDWHTPFIFTAQLFAEAGHEVYVLGRKPQPGFVLPEPADFGPGIRVEKRSGDHGGVKGRLEFLRFCQRAIMLSRRFKPDIIIGFDIMGFIAAFGAQLLRKQAKLIYHNFDLVSREGLSAFMSILKNIELYAARRADKIIVSSPGRADILQEQAHLSQKPLVVMNCQRLDVPSRHTGELHQIIKDKGLAFDRLVVRMGLIGPGNAVEATIRSISEWKGNWGFVCVGAPFPDFLKQMRELVQSLGLEDKVIFLPSAPYKLWYDCLSSADVGVALYVPADINNQTMAGAGTKLNLYLSAGVPSIIPQIPDFIEFDAKYRVGVVADSTDPHSIAEAINEVLSNPQKHALLSRNAQKAFEEDYNFERQYEPIMNYVQNLSAR